MTAVELDRTLRNTSWLLTFALVGFSLFLYVELPESVVIESAGQVEEERVYKRYVLFIAMLCFTLVQLMNRWAKVPHKHPYWVRITPENQGELYRNSIRMLRYWQVLFALFAWLLLYHLLQSFQGNTDAYLTNIIQIALAVLALPLLINVYQTYRIAQNAK